MILTGTPDAGRGPSPARARPSRPRTAAAGAAIAAGLLLAGLLLPPWVTCIEIRALGARVYLPLEGAERLRFAFVHSVERTEVVEEFVVGPGGGLVLVATSFQSLGAGLGGLEGHRLVTADGHFRVGDIDRPVGTLVLRVTALSSPVLAYASDRIDLLSLAVDGARVEVRSLRLPGLVSRVLTARYPPPRDPG